MRKRRTASSLAVTIGRLLLSLGPRWFGLAERVFARAAGSGADAEGWLAFAQGLVASQRGEHETALEKLRAASIGLPDNADVAISLALALANADKWDVALEAGERALKFYEGAGESSNLWQMLAWGYLITGRYASVLDLMQRMREGGVRITLIHLPLLLARAMMWDEEPPITALRAMLRNHPQLRACLRFVEHVAETKNESLGVMILSALPTATAVQALDTMATRAAGVGKAEQVLWAANALRRLELAPELSLALASVASLVAGDTQASATYAEQADQMGPNHAGVQERLAMVRLLAGDQKAARVAAVKAVMGGSVDALAAALVASGLVEQGQVRDARRIFVVQRVGDTLGALLGHVTQAWIFALDQDWEDMRRVLGFAAEECSEVPSWMRTSALRAFLEQCLLPIAGVDPEEQNTEALQRLQNWVSSLPPETPKAKKESE